MQSVNERLGAISRYIDVCNELLEYTADITTAQQIDDETDKLARE